MFSLFVFSWISPRPQTYVFCMCLFMFLKENISIKKGCLKNGIKIKRICVVAYPTCTSFKKLSHETIFKIENNVFENNIQKVEVGEFNLTMLTKLSNKLNGNY